MCQEGAGAASEAGGVREAARIRRPGCQAGLLMLLPLWLLAVVAAARMRMPRWRCSSAGQRSCPHRCAFGWFQCRANIAGTMLQTCRHRPGRHREVMYTGWVKQPSSCVQLISKAAYAKECSGGPTPRKGPRLRRRHLPALRCNLSVTLFPTSKPPAGVSARRIA